MKSALIYIILIGIVSLTACQIHTAPTLHINSITENKTTQDADIKRIAVSFSQNHHPTWVARQTGTIRGYEIVDYAVFLKQGQYLNISLASRNPAAYFNILPPNNDAAIFIGSINGNQFEGVAPITGEYRIRVYQMRASARRGEAAHFGIEIITNQL